MTKSSNRISALKSTSEGIRLRPLLCVAAMSSLAQLRLRDGYREAEAT